MAGSPTTRTSSRWSSRGRQPALNKTTESSIGPCVLGCGTIGDRTQDFLLLSLFGRRPDGVRQPHGRKEMGKVGRIRVVTDSTADMEGETADRLGIVVVPLNVHWNGDTYLDKVEITIDEFYRKLREEKGTPKTSQPSTGQFEAVYRRLLKEAGAIVSLHISGKLSGTFNSAQVAARNVAPDRIVVIDSLATTFPLGSLAARVAALAQQGASLKECVALAEDLVPRIRIFAAVDTLEFLRRGGRIGRAQAFAGNLLSIKLIFQVLGGEVLPVDRVRTRAAAVKRLAEVVSNLGPVEEMAIVYGDDPQPAEVLRALVEQSYPGLQLTGGRIGPVLGTHTGPGVIGVCAILSNDRG